MRVAKFFANSESRHLIEIVSHEYSGSFAGRKPRNCRFVPPQPDFLLMENARNCSAVRFAMLIPQREDT
jgi:hypothetical protein